jgi:hypothetical protein
VLTAAHAQTPWVRLGRLWAAPAAFHMLRAAAARPAPGTAELLGDLRAPSTAALLDHRVAGRPLAPGAALLELAAAAGRLLAGGLPGVVA